jgi:hypothetical protein
LAKEFLLALDKHQSSVNDTANLCGEIAVAIIQRTIKFIDPDAVIVKLAISLCAFSNSISVYSPNFTVKPTNTIAIFEMKQKCLQDENFVK